MNRKEQFYTGEVYHVYNRGVDSRLIFSDLQDLNRFMKSITLMNSIEPIVHLNDNRNPNISHSELVEILGYCILNNHYHFLLKQKVDGGISEFMKRLDGGYTNYFNLRHKRSGSLFQSKFKSKHIDSDEYSVMITGYVHANYCIHPNKSWGYIGKDNYIISSITENTGNNPFHICNNLFNPLEIRSSKFKTWCKSMSKQIYSDRKSNKKLQKFSLE